MKKARKAQTALIKPDVEVVESVEAELYKNVRSYIAKARAKVYTVANKEMVAAYWNVGREIVEKQGGAERAKYGDGLIKGLSLKLTAEFGPGFDVANLRNMRQFFLVFGKRYTLCSELNWSHYRTLMRIKNATLNEHERNLFAVKYHLNLPTVEELQLELCRERAAIEEALLLNGPETTKSVSARSSGRKRGAK